jgi:hypothetical protein
MQRLAPALHERGGMSTLPLPIPRTTLRFVANDVEGMVRRQGRSGCTVTLSVPAHTDMDWVQRELHSLLEARGLRDVRILVQAGPGPLRVTHCEFDADNWLGIRPTED